MSCSVDELLEIFEMLLAFHAWYKYDPKPTEDLSRIQHLIHVMLPFIEAHFRRPGNNMGYHERRSVICVYSCPNTQPVLGYGTLRFLPAHKHWYWYHYY